MMYLPNSLLAIALTVILLRHSVGPRLKRICVSALARRAAGESAECARDASPRMHAVMSDPSASTDACWLRG
jgi:hypothetical protein